MGSDLMLVAGLLVLGWSVYIFVSKLLAAQSEQKALLWASVDQPEKSKSGFIEFSRPLVHRFCLSLASKIKSESYRKSVKRKIGTAGLERVLNVDEFIGIQILWGLLFPLMLVLLNFSLELGYPLPLVIMTGFLGMWFPHFHVNSEKKRRYLSVIVDLPYFTDILALSTEAGLDFVGAIQRVVDKAEDSVLAVELGQVLQDIKLGQSRAQALKGLADRLDINEVTSFVAVIVDADATGASIGSVLKQQSVQMRVERFARAEKAGARASQAILIPLMLFILPAVFIMVFGPVILQFLGQGS